MKYTLILVILVGLISCNKEEPLPSPCQYECDRDTLETIWVKPINNDTTMSAGIQSYVILSKFVHIDNSSQRTLVTRNLEDGEIINQISYHANSSPINRESAFMINQDYYIENEQQRNFCFNINTGKLNWHKFDQYGDNHAYSYGNFYYYSVPNNYYPWITETEIIQCELETGNCKTIFTIKQDSIQHNPNLRQLGVGKNLQGESILYIGAQMTTPSPNYNEQANLIAYNLDRDTIEWELKNITVEGGFYGLYANQGHMKIDEENRLLYVVTGYGIHCFDMDNGNTKWEFNLFDNNNSVGSNWQYQDDKLVFFTDQLTAYCINRFTGELIWNRKELISNPGFFRIEPNGKIFVAKEKMSVIDINTGETIWWCKSPMRGGGYMSPPVLDWDAGKMWFTDNFFVYCCKIPEELY